MIYLIIFIIANEFFYNKLSKRKRKYIYYDLTKIDIKNIINENEKCQMPLLRKLK